MSEFQPGAIIAERYLVESKLGSGGIGTVYLARDPDLNRKVAIKLLHQGTINANAAARFEREAIALSLLVHPNIVRIFRYGFLDKETPFLVMEYIEGNSLHDLINEKQMLSCREAVTIGLQICSALEYAHERQIIHRDLKPENVIVSSHENGSFLSKILDFGLCKQEVENADAHTLTETGFLVGTALYMSPEQCLGKPVDLSTDIYAFGCILFEMITGEPPFIAESPAAILFKHISEPFPRLLELSPKSGLPEELDRLILKCTAKDRADRFADFAEVRESLMLIEKLNCQASFNRAEAASMRTPVGRAIRHLPFRAVKIAGIFLAGLILCSAYILGFTERGNAILAEQIQNSFSATEAIGILKKLLHVKLNAGSFKEAASIVDKSTKSLRYKTWPFQDKENLLKAYIQEYDQAKQDDGAFVLRLRQLSNLLEYMKKYRHTGRRPDKEAQEDLNALSLELLKTGKDSRKWKEIFICIEKNPSALSRTRPEYLLLASILRVEAMLRQESTFSNDRLHDLAEECMYTSDCAANTAIPADRRKTVEHYAGETFRVAKKIDLISAQHIQHVTLGQYYLRTGELQKAKEELSLAEEIGKELLLSQGNHDRLMWLKDGCRLGRYLDHGEFRKLHPDQIRAENPFIQLVK